ncbi:MAG TPA: hypothetical protein VJ729_12730 [Nitrososphaeraceae archaeon]|jgi:hypothetical protein|nr:hypothetical protein [Nitrososphaeraceae archaeon]
MMAFDGALITGVFIIPTDEMSIQVALFMLDKDKHTGLTIDKGKKYY